MKRTLIIAEAGVNHNGNIEIAKKLVDEAKNAGADVVKFQTFNVDELVSEKAKMAEYQKKNIGKVQTQKEMLESLALSKEEFIQLADYCNSKDIIFLSTPFDIDSIHFLDGLQNMWKIPSGEITNYPYLVEIGKTCKKVILSTGMSSIDEIHDAVNVLNESGTKEIVILHCTTEYPTPLCEVNLRVMDTLRKEFGYDVGYSDHTQGIVVDLAAVAMGAVVIEKHFTLDKNMEGPDHKASLEPQELKAMVDGIRNIEMAMGTEDKNPTVSEVKNRDVVRKSIVAKKAIHQGEVFSEINLTTKRPGNGISPMQWNHVIGRIATRDYEKDDLIEL